MKSAFALAFKITAGVLVAYLIIAFGGALITFGLGLLALRWFDIVQAAPAASLAVTFTLLVSIPDEESPSCAQDLAERVRADLETGTGNGTSYTVATVDAVAGDRLGMSYPLEKVRRDHAHIAGDTYAGPRRFRTAQQEAGKARTAS